ncbi:MAG TPA: hypothetical protein VFH56_16360 [Acidimicrobiales bacterium]|nr:hypothetical protein [Acidimicrobiales bacterium]
MSFGDIANSIRVAQALASGALRSIAAAIRRGLSGLGLFNWIRRKWGPLTSPEASVLYQSGVNAVKAAQVQNTLGQAAPINPALVPQVPGAFQLYPESVQFIYDVRLGWLDPTTGEQRWYSVYVTEQQAMAAAGLFQAAVELINWQAYEVELGGHLPSSPSQFVNYFDFASIIRR